jgi:cytochrome c peroxidase
VTRSALPAAAALLLALVVVAAAALGRTTTTTWSASELATIRSLWIGSLEPLPPDRSNRVADDPRAVALGQALFFDTRFSADGTVACATCHVPELAFTDGRPRSRGIGDVPRKSMTVIGTAYSPWLFWDGRKDSLWAQALGPLESPVEHGIDRGRVAHLVHDHYRAPYEALFGPLPELADARRFPSAAGPVEDAAAAASWEAMAREDRDAVTQVFVNVGKAIAAYERRILPGPSRFDRFAEALLAGDAGRAAALLGEDEIAGLRLFIGGGACVDCHNGPLFTNNAFHNTGVPAPTGLPPDTGRALGARQVVADEFNCLGRWSDAGGEGCAELRFLKVDHHVLERAFKPPTLRNVAEAAPYMHAGQFATLREVLEHYDRAPEAPSGHSELVPLHLTEADLLRLEAFLRSLSGPLATPPELLAPPRVAPRGGVAPHGGRSAP